MPRILHQGTHTYSASGRGDVLASPWRPGEVREVPEEVAAYLLADFPGAFVTVPTPESVAVVIDTPPADRAMRPPKARKPKPAAG